MFSHDEIHTEDLYFFKSTFKEDPINFLPTYKFFPNSEIYNTGNTDKKTPSWTDRIFYDDQFCDWFDIKIYETDMGTMFSDHRPVYLECEMLVNKLRFKGLRNFFN